MRWEAAIVGERDLRVQPELGVVRAGGHGCARVRADRPHLRRNESGCRSRRRRWACGEDAVTAEMRQADGSGMEPIVCGCRLTRQRPSQAEPDRHHLHCRDGVKSVRKRLLPRLVPKHRPPRIGPRASRQERPAAARSAPPSAAARPPPCRSRKMRRRGSSGR